MSQICKANPCCGNFYGDCEIPLPQHRSGLWFHNSEEYRRKADEQEKPATQEPSQGRAGEMTPDRAIYFLERFKREEKMLGPNEQWALEFAIAALSPSPETKMRWVKGVETAPYASTVLAGYFDEEVGEWIVELFVAKRPEAPFTHWLWFCRPDEQEPVDAVTYDRIERLMHAVEGECDGLAIDAGQAMAILAYVMTGEAPPQEHVSVPQSAIDWLLGEGPDANGEHFGDNIPERAPRYWWRSHFRKFIFNVTQSPSPQMTGWDAHKEFKRSALAARQAFDHVVGSEVAATVVRKHEARNLAHLRKVYLEARETYPAFADTLAWLLWWDILEFDRLVCLSEPATAEGQP